MTNPLVLGLRVNAVMAQIALHQAAITAAQIRISAGVHLKRDLSIGGYSEGRPASDEEKLQFELEGVANHLRKIQECQEQLAQWASDEEQSSGVY